MRLIWNIFKGSWLLQVATALFAGWLALKGNNLYQRNVGADRVIEKVNKEAEKISAKAVDARKRADVPDAADRLRQRSCRDC